MNYIKFFTWFKKSNYNTLLIITDNQSSLAALSVAFPRIYVIKNIDKTLLTIPKRQISISWAKSHVGNVSKERADSRAKHAVTKNEYNENLDLLIPTSIVKNVFTKKALGDWQTLMDPLLKGRYTYIILNKLNPDFICEQPVLAYLLSNHDSFPDFLRKIGKRKSALCSCDKYSGNSIHYIFGNTPLMKFQFK